MINSFSFISPERWSNTESNMTFYPKMLSVNVSEMSLMISASFKVSQRLLCKHNKATNRSTSNVDSVKRWLPRSRLSVVRLIPIICMNKLTVSLMSKNWACSLSASARVSFLSASAGFYQERLKDRQGD